MNVQDLIAKATEAANRAGYHWLETSKVKYVVTDGFTGRPVGTMLDICGRSNVQFRDKRTKHYRAFKAAGVIGYNAVVEIPHNYRMHQEMGLLQACSNAAKKVLEDAGVEGLTLWEWVD